LDPPDQLVSGILRCPGLLVHLRSIMASMNQKSSLAQTPKSNRQVLKSDKRSLLKPQIASAVQNGWIAREISSLRCNTADPHRRF
ncbi:hypothetical protein, partial [Pseudaestuariivita rosea]|uniref:hypothetical protein n=1 Tax=Pseudaestuariivita rosea TaxID=2763263 RepID=UPI001ABA0B51